MNLCVLPILLTLISMSSAAAQNYSAERATQDGIEIVRLTDARHKTQVSIVPSIGNNAYEMKVNGKNIFHFPASSLAEFKQKPSFSANPFMAPWANRLDHDGFYANGKHYSLDSQLANFRRDPNKLPIHGLLVYSPHWQISKVAADANGASITSKLEFFRYPEYMAHFPFAHTVSMTYRLQDGVLQVETLVENHASEPMPVSLGYHPYFRLHDSPRDSWKVVMPAGTHLRLSAQLIPTGETEPANLASPISLEGRQLDDVYGELKQSANGRAEFSVQGKQEKISVFFGLKYPVAVVYAPSGREFICFEPMTGPTNAFNLHHEGKIKELQQIAPGATWSESFWIQPSGF